MTARAAGFIGGVCGLAWGAALRGWMVEIAGPARSEVTWLTVLFVLLPGTIVGVAFGRAVLLRACGHRVGRPTVLSPILFGTAILDPTIFHQLITDGRGGGSLLVVASMLAGGFALSRRRWSIARVACAAVAVFGVVAMFGISSLAGPLNTPRGVWVAVFGAAILAVGCMASALPYPRLDRLRPALSSPSVAHAIEPSGTSAAGGLSS